MANLAGYCWAFILKVLHLAEMFLEYLAALSQIVYTQWPNCGLNKKLVAKWSPHQLFVVLLRFNLFKNILWLVKLVTDL